jgi:hypothetical protein
LSIPKNAELDFILIQDRQLVIKIPEGFYLPTVNGQDNIAPANPALLRPAVTLDGHNHDSLN